MPHKTTKFIFHLFSSLYFLTTSFHAWCFVIPIEVDDTTTTQPLCVIYTTAPDGEQHLNIHAALYEDGRLYWTEGYRDFSYPPDAEYFIDNLASYSVSFASLTDEEINTFKSTITSRKTVAQYGEQAWRFDVHFAYTTVLYFENGLYFSMKSSYNFDLNAALARVYALQNPNLTLTPTPIPIEAQPFFDDWNYVTDALFTLVDNHKDDAVSLGVLTFEPLRVID